MRILKVAALACMMTTSLTSVAQAVPLVALAFGPAFAATIGGQILGIVFGAVGSYLLSAAAGAIFGQTAAASDTTQSSTTEVQYGERVSRSGIFGTVLVGGHLVHINEYDDAKQLQQVFILGDGQHTNITGIKVNGIQKTLTTIASSGNNEHVNYEVEDFEDVIALRLHDGRVGQAADAALVAQTPDWTSAKKYSNLAYAVADCKSDKEKFNGIPDFQWIVQGLRCYDPRKDSTVGGSGAHRFNDPATWEYSANPAVQMYHFLRGFYFNGIRFLGVGYAASEISLAHFITAMNICDLNKVDPNGANRPQYECHMQVEDTTEFATVLDSFADAMGGFWTELAGQIVVFAGAAQSSVLTITDDDLLDDEDMVFNPGRPGETLVTGIQGTYIHSTDFQATPYTAIIPPEFDNPNWYPHIQEYNFNQVRNPHQAYLLAKQKLYANRVQASATIALEFQKLILQVGDWITWNSDIPGNGTRQWRITQIAYAIARRRMYLSLSEVDPDTYDDDATPTDIEEPIRILPPPVYLTSVSNFDLGPINLQGVSGESLPALEFTYDPILDPAVAAIEIHYRVAADGPDPAGPIFKTMDFSPQDGVHRATNGVTPGKVHEAFARMIVQPGREVVDTDWVQALFPNDDMMVPGASIPDASIEIAKLSADLQNLMTLISGSDDNSLWSRIARLQADIEAQANAALVNSTNFASKTTLLARATSTSAAAVYSEATVRAEADAALAEQIIGVEAQIETAVNEGLAGGYLKFQAAIDEMAGTASVTAVVRAQLGDLYSTGAWVLQAEVDGVGGTTLSAFGVFADTFFVVNSAGDTMEQAFAFTGGEAVLKVANIEHIKSGLLTDPTEVEFIIDLTNKEIFMEN